MNRMHVALPKPRDTTRRPSVIPPSVAAARARMDASTSAPSTRSRTERDIQVDHPLFYCNLVRLASQALAWPAGLQHLCHESARIKFGTLSRCWDGLNGAALSAIFGVCISAPVQQRLPSRHVCLLFNFYGILFCCVQGQALL